MNLHQKFEDKPFFKAFSAECCSPFLIAFWCVLTFLSSAFGLELFYYTFACLVSAVILLFCKNLLPLVTIFSCFYFSPSMRNNPGRNSESVFFPEHGLYYIIFLILLLVALFVYRLTSDIRHGLIRPKKPKLSVGFLLLGIVFMAGGIGYDDYTGMTLLFGFLEIASLCIFYFFFALCLDWESVPSDYIFRLCAFLGLNVGMQTMFVYAFDAILVDGAILRSGIYVGWGHYNNIGAAIAMLLPAPIYLSAQRKQGVLWYLFACYLLAMLFLTRSRTSIAVGCAIFVLASVAMFFCAKGGTRVCNLGIFVVLLGIGMTMLFKEDSFLRRMWDDLLDFPEEGASRIEIYERGIALFREYPLFGTGFYSCDMGRWGSGQDSLIPARWHSTYVQLLASCGAVGLCAYLFHRVETLIMFFKKPSKRKIFLAFSILALLAASLLDCHFFNLGPGLLYGLFLVFMEKDGEMAEK